MRIAAALSDSSSVMVSPDSDSASKWFGVTKRCQRQDLGLQGLIGVQGVAGLLALADQDRVQDHMLEGAICQRLLHSADGCRAAEHADLHCVQHRRCAGSGTIGRRRGFQLVRDDLLVHRHKAVVPVVLRVEGNNAGEVRDAEHSEFLEGLEIGLRAGATGRFGTGDGQGDGRGNS